MEKKEESSSTLLVKDETPIENRARYYKKDADFLPKSTYENNQKCFNDNFNVQQTFNLDISSEFSLKESNLIFANKKKKLISKETRLQTPVGSHRLRAKSKKRDDFSLLPNELICLILDYLPLYQIPEIGRLNRRFFKICIDNFLWNYRFNQLVQSLYPVDYIPKRRKSSVDTLRMIERKVRGYHYVKHLHQSLNSVKQFVFSRKLYSSSSSSSLLTKISPSTSPSSISPSTSPSSTSPSSPSQLLHLLLNPSSKSPPKIQRITSASSSSSINKSFLSQNRIINNNNNNNNIIYNNNNNNIIYNNIIDNNNINNNNNIIDNSDNIIDNSNKINKNNFNKDNNNNNNNNNNDNDNINSDNIIDNSNKIINNTNIRFNINNNNNNNNDNEEEKKINNNNNNINNNNNNNNNISNNIIELPPVRRVNSNNNKETFINNARINYSQLNNYQIKSFSTIECLKQKKEEEEMNNNIKEVVKLNNLMEDKGTSLLLLCNQYNEDVNIWDESCEGNLLWAERKECNSKVVRAGSLNKLIEFLTSVNEFDLQFVKAFLMTFESFTTVEMLFIKLMQRFRVPLKTKQNFASIDVWRKELVQPVRFRVINIIKLLIDKHVERVCHNSWMMERIAVLIGITLPISGFATLANQLSQLLNKKIEEYERKEDQVEELSELKRVEPNFSWAPFSPDLIASQMTLLDHLTYRAIKPSEMLNKKWLESNKTFHSPHLVKLLKRFNSLSYWVVSEVLSFNDVKIRATYIEKFIAISNQLLKYNNFLSLTAVLSALHSFPISRLKRTWANISKEMADLFQKLGDIVNPHCSYKNYKQAIHAAEPPCVPFIGAYLMDLDFLEDSRDPSGLIQFSRRQRIYEVISNALMYQSPCYTMIERHSLLYNYLYYLPQDKTEEELSNRSIEIEPRIDN